MYPGDGMALQPEHTDCVDVLSSRVVETPYSYQYVVGAPFGVTFPVTTAVELDGDTFRSVTTLGAAAFGESGVGVGVEPCELDGVVVAVSPGTAFMVVKNIHPPPKRTSATSSPIKKL